MQFDSDGDETNSELNSVDEGAIAILSMEEIRNMKRLQADYERNLLKQDAFVVIKRTRGLSDEEIQLDQEVESEAFGNNQVLDHDEDNLLRIIGMQTKSQTPRTSANSHIFKDDVELDGH